jgi:threonine-phosphate decarboxylase
VGYALADPDTARRMAALQEGWPVGELALRAAAAALADAAYARRSLAAFHADAPDFAAGLEALGLHPLPSAAPFVLVPLPGSGTELARALRPQGILVRTCSEWPGLGDRFVRLALRGRGDWPALFRALRAWLG